MKDYDVTITALVTKTIRVPAKDEEHACKRGRKEFKLVASCHGQVECTKAVAKVATTRALSYCLVSCAIC